MAKLIIQPVFYWKFPLSQPGSIPEVVVVQADVLQTHWFLQVLGDMPLHRWCISNHSLLMISILAIRLHADEFNLFCIQYTLQHKIHTVLDVLILCAQTDLFKMTALALTVSDISSFFSIYCVVCNKEIIKSMMHCYKPC